MHGAHSDASFGSQLQHVGIAGEPGNIIDDFCAQLDSRACHDGLGCIDGDRYLHAIGQGLDDRFDASQFFRGGHRFTVGTRTLAADVENIRPRIFQTQCLFDRL